MGKSIIEGFSKIEVARKVTDLAMNKGWKPISKIQMQESFRHDGIAKYICVMENENEDTHGIHGFDVKWSGRQFKAKVKS